MGNSHGITLSPNTPIISKLLERTVLDVCDDLFFTDYLQYGFKTSTGTTIVDTLLYLRPHV